ncbi:hypothetical protein [Saccharothrix texasensis]|uniref:DoxX-like protein n=2 Tax=Saccharothrix TaxID=2071 RepID=A0A3N1HDD6_9PSEU|nr:hypothetical protein [Saccharothrix texasensis]ROP40491.1 hypothetical protein EDD40_5903 [Saccharothrix texasensis]
MSKWQRVVLTLLLMTEVAVTLVPVVRGLLFEPSLPEVVAGGEVRRVFQEADVPVGQPPGLRQGVLLGTTMLMLVTALSALAPVWLRPGSRMWLATFTGTHLAAVGLGWVHNLPLMTLLAAVSAVGVPLLVLAPPRRGQ